MPQATAIGLYGTNKNFDELTKILGLDLNDLTDSGDISGGKGLDLSSLTNANLDDYAHKILYAILLRIEQNQNPEGLNDPELNVLVQEGGIRALTGVRAGQMQRSYIVSFFTSDPSLNVSIDADNI